MNPRQLMALVWLRWRLAMAELRRLGMVSRVIIGLLAILVVLTSIAGFVVTLVAGVYLLPDAEPIHLLILLDVVAGGFLFFWLIGFLGELQRGEPLSLEKLLHLPVSLRGAFLLNYFSSFASLTMVVFLPAMLALCIAIPIALGWKMLIVIPLMAGFLLLTTAVTFQIRGWLGKLMSNPRKRRTVLVAITAGAILLFQLPGLAGMWLGRQAKDNDTFVDYTVKQAELIAKIESEGVTQAEQKEWNDELVRLNEQHRAAKELEEQHTRELLLFWAQRGHVAIPFGWFPYGIYRMAEHAPWPAIFGSLGLLGMAAGSLHFSYRSTIDYYRRAGTSRKTRQTSSAKLSAASGTAAKQRNAMKNPFPGLPLQSGMVARASFLTLIRSPAVKMQFLAPIMMSIMMAFAFYSAKDEIPDAIGPLFAAGLLTMNSFAILNLLFNQFGYDGHSFRAYMLLPVTGRDWLLGKNASLAPILIMTTILALLVARLVMPIAIMDLLACIPLSISLYLAWLIIGNFISTRFPMPAPTTSMRKPRMNLKTALAQVGTLLLVPFFVGPIGAPMALQAACHHFGWLPYVPVALMLELVILLIVGTIYWQLLPAAGRYLKSRQEFVLTDVTKGED